MTGPDYEDAASLAGIPSADDVLDHDEAAKRFDLFAAVRTRTQGIANALAEQKSIPVIAANIERIAAVASDGVAG